jgi:hypothetical protein
MVQTTMIVLVVQMEPTSSTKSVGLHVQKEPMNMILLLPVKFVMLDVKPVTMKPIKIVHLVIIHMFS